ncbi:MAG: hypothetical protein ACI8RZ_002245 [Myxococcota bacterium]|jgi:hypothetical protein
MGRKKRSGPLRYRKTEHRFLEDLVLLLRVAGEMKLDPDQADGEQAKQAYSAAELSHWQANVMGSDLPKQFDHLKPSALSETFPGTNGLLSDDVLGKIMAFQAPDHDRILAVQRDGVWRYAAHQGLHEAMRYTELAACPPSLTVAMHLTKVPTARALLAGEPTENNKTRYKLRADPTFTITPGHLVPLGRYIHAFGWFQIVDGALTAVPDRWPLRARLFKRFRDRVGFGVDMAALKAHYAAKGVDWADVCGINAIGTVIFLLPVPPQVFLARGRTPGAATGGEAFDMVTLWRVTDAEIAGGQVP